LVTVKAGAVIMFRITVTGGVDIYLSGNSVAVVVAVGVEDAVPAGA
jgi:hypothetical protein